MVSSWEFIFIFHQLLEKASVGTDISDGLDFSNGLHQAHAAVSHLWDNDIRCQSDVTLFAHQEGQSDCGGPADAGPAVDEDPGLGAGQPDLASLVRQASSMTKQWKTIIKKKLRKS